MTSIFIKRIYSILYCLTLILNVKSQVKPAAGTQPNAVAIPIPTAYQNPIKSYVRTWIPSMPTTDPATVTATTRSLSEVLQMTDYADGLLRPLQSVAKGLSTSGKDIVVPNVYDQFGRSKYTYLPYVQTTGNVSDGKFKNDPFAGQNVFYKDNVLSPSSKGESIFYGATEFELAPSSVPIKSFGPGNTWSKEGAARSQQQYSFSNTVSDSVRVWTLNASGIPTTTRIYPAGELSERQYKDQTGTQLVDYFDKSGKLILKKSQSAAIPGTAHLGWLCTYFVYDDFGKLRVIIPPLAVEKIMPTWNISSILSGLCIMYRYDARGRNIVAKLPGADSTETIYDTRDRPVLSRDGNLKAKQQWLITYYDGLDRPVKTSLYASASTRSALQAQVDVAPIGTFPFITGANLTDLVFTFYDDNYSFQGAQVPVTSDFGKPQSGSNPYPEANISISHRLSGKVTGARIRVLGTNQWLAATIYYNDKGRVIQTISDNIAGGKAVTTYLYDFSGKLLSTYLRHTNPRSTITPQTTILTQTLFNASGKITETSILLNDVAATKRTVGSYSYDEGGRLKTRRLGIINNIARETLNYDFTIQGWLKAINKDFVNTAGSSTNWFGEELAYDYGFTANQYDGGIAGTKWKSRGDGIARAYGYSYDSTNRILKADFSQQNAGATAWTTDKVDFSVSGLGYDANGNIQSMVQKGMKGLSIATIDSLKYGYIPNTNKVFFVTDKNNDPQSKLGDFKEINNNESQDYAYDSSGNLTLDMNRLLSPKPYNFLNLPDSLTVLGKGYIEYAYDALGNRLRKKVTDVSGSTVVVKTMDYIDGFVYQNDSLLYFSHDEGRVRATYATGKPVALVYDYFISDHLDNTRSILTEETNLASYAATMETASSAKENALFSNIDNTRSAKPVGYPADGTTSPNDYVSKLNASAGTQKIGPSIVLRVMAGDTIQLGAKAFYKSAAASTSSTTPANMLAALLQAFASGSMPSEGVHGNGTGPGSPLATNFSAANYQAIRDKDPNQNQTAKPKAYLNYVLFDDLLNMVDENSGVRQVQGSPDQLQTLATDRMVIKKDGFIYVYTSNESIQDVFFDNIVVAHNSGPLLEETHYYPFGLTMAGISSKALKNPYAENKNNYNGIEQTTELGLNQYDAEYRTLDPQTGRWWQMDPAAETYPGISPYSSSFNNPIYFNDPLGDDPIKVFIDGVGWTYTYIVPETGRAVAKNLAKGFADGAIRSFATNGFNQIASYVNRQNLGSQRIDLQTLPSLQAEPMTMPDDQNFELNNGFPIRNFEAYNTTPQAFRDGIAVNRKTFIFVTDYVEPVVTTVTTMGLEGLLTSGVVRKLSVSTIFRMARNGGKAVGQTAAETTGLTSSFASRGVQANRTAGNVFRDELAQALEAEGKTVYKEVYKKTPFGRRYLDIDVWTAPIESGGRNLGGIEAKASMNARYRAAQRAKDIWLWFAERYRVNVVRKPLNW
ncbi:DUF6443 domain-containing protein [Chryseobacterium paludis]|uniref:DUF6443 domain-containing protein n=1 Tax=Chryseobacterium paludis TaxID=2956784 RepID=UPI0021C15226|nr:DUF6443 domain-containing protein [Chryseobacterium paludis]